jgi:hypothetical protein
MEDEWASPENPFSMEDEWASPENPFSTEDEMLGEAASGEWGESDQFFPLLAAAAPLLGKLLPVAKKAVGHVVGGLLRPGARRRRPRRRGAPPAGAGRPPGRVYRRGPVPAPAYRPRVVRPGPGRWPGARRATVAGLLRQLSDVLGHGEVAAAEMEAQLFGSGEALGEVAETEAAAEAALTEVLAAEAAHTEDEAEAEALLAAATPITIRIIVGRRGLRRLTPALVRANSDLVRSLRAGGGVSRQLVRAQPAILRRTVSSIATAQRQGRRVPPAMVAPIMAGHAARVLGSRQRMSRAVARNLAVRQRTVAPARRRVAR